MFDWQSFTDQNNLIIGLVVGALVFLVGSFWSIRVINRTPTPERIMRREISAGTVKIILISGFLVLGIVSILAWRSAVVFWIAYILFISIKRGVQQLKAKSRPSAKST